MRKLTAFLLLLCTVAVVSCGTKNIRGTEIPDTEENRSVLKTFGEYVLAVKKQDPEKIVVLVSDNYYDENGTDDATDDVDYKGIVKFLGSSEFKEILKIDLIFVVKDLIVENGTAKLLYFYEGRFKTDDKLSKMKKSSIQSDSERWEKISDENLMVLKKENGEWKIVSGL